MIEVVSAVIVKDGRILLTQRPSDKDYPFTWECPGGKVEGNESHHEAIVRELREEIGVRVKPIKHHDGTDGAVAIAQQALWCGKVTDEIFLLMYRVELDDVAPPKPLEGQGIGWFAISEMRALELAPGNLMAFSSIARHVWSTFTNPRVK